MLCAHHYVASSARRRSDPEAPRPVGRQWRFFGRLGPRQHTRPSASSFHHDLPIDTECRESHDEFIKLTLTYYNPAIRTKHTDIGGVTHLGLGYGGCALPLVLEHNTPNNSIALLWAETDSSAFAMAFPHRRCGRSFAVASGTS